ncbi:hypothetical protein [Flavihumibacter petaseus]|uniref:Uncharacterized protein n=1 Tax=Flavihumibacter petaseus NBRC 106054 TaxID=1220578 RepID=A0A0E9MVR1_9BACT|nr:hypothetical protein [Flavihumibacter petaseus]GAO41578.1 hypothetical protein FPE01S_01_05920 [Flavihumibacter petaseus NBRC 106054]
MENSKPLQATTNIPFQIAGGTQTICLELSAESVLKAHVKFQVGSARLLNVNEWNSGTGWRGHFESVLLNAKGKKLDGLAEKGTFIHLRRNTGPGRKNELWFAVESIESGGAKDEDTSFFSIRLRPCPEPGSTVFQENYFFQTTTTFNLLLYRRALVLYGCLITRNDQEEDADKPSPPLPWKELFQYVFAADAAKISSL